MTTLHFIGDVHGHLAQLHALLERLGYRRPQPVEDPHLWVPPPGCTLISVGDLVDRGPANLDCLRTLLRMAQAGHARVVLGNHELRLVELLRAQLGAAVEAPGATLAHGATAEAAPAPGPEHQGIGRRLTWTELLTLQRAERSSLLVALQGLPLYLELEPEPVVVVHARWDPALRRAGRCEQEQVYAFGRPEPRTRERVPDGDHPLPYATLRPEVPLPARAQWVRGYRGRRLVVWGHQTVRRGAVVRVGNTLNLESGCLNGHPLSAWIYPDDRVVQVPGPRPWRVVTNPYRAAARLAYPYDLATVGEVAQRWGTCTADEYVLALGWELQELGCPAPAPWLVETHRRLFVRWAHGR